jgi:probable HAF family extracellular repeat protein
MTVSRSPVFLPLSLAIGVTVVSGAFGVAHAACTTATPCVTTPEALGSTVDGVSLNGTIAVGRYFNGSATHAYRWNSGGGGILDLGTLGGTLSQASAVSADGSVIVGLSKDAANRDRAFIWTSGGGMVDLGTLGGTQANAYDVSADGSVVVGFSGIGQEIHAFRWTGGTMQDLGTFAGGRYATARGVSGDGQVVVGNSELADLSTYHAFRWTSAGGMVDLGTLGGPFSEASDANFDGSVVVGSFQFSGAAMHAFRWTAAAGMTDLGTLAGGIDARAYAISADGSIIVGSATVNGLQSNHAFRWTAGSGMSDLNTLLANAGVNMSGILLTEARAISPDSQFIGGVGNFSGNSHGFLVRYFDREGGPLLA